MFSTTKSKTFFVMMVMAIVFAFTADANPTQTVRSNEVEQFVPVPMVDQVFAAGVLQDFWLKTDQLVGFVDDGGSETITIQLETPEGEIETTFTWEHRDEVIIIDIP